MIGESFTLLKSNGANRKSADEPWDEIGTVHKIVAALLSFVIAGTTIFTVAMPFALLHLR